MKTSLRSALTGYPFLFSWGAVCLLACGKATTVPPVESGGTGGGTLSGGNESAGGEGSTADSSGGSGGDGPCQPQTEFFVDADGDGAGEPQSTVLLCESEAPDGYSAQGSDCDDDDPLRAPHVAEMFGDDVDSDCDGSDDPDQCSPVETEIESSCPGADVGIIGAYTCRGYACSQNFHLHLENTGSEEFDGVVEITVNYPVYDGEPTDEDSETLTKQVIIPAADAAAPIPMFSLSEFWENAEIVVTAAENCNPENDSFIVPFTATECGWYR